MAGSPRSIAVVGAGALGGWTALELAKRGADVTLIDSWGPGNLRASSSGERRIIRATYGPDGFYVPLVARSFEKWSDLERETGLELYEETGLLWLFGESDAYAVSAQRHLKAHGFALEELQLARARSRFPQFRFDDVQKIFFEPRAGTIAARVSVRALRDLFVHTGGVYRNARVLPPVVKQRRIQSIRLADLPDFAADKYVFACGPWLREIFPDTLGHLIRVSRQEEFYLGPPPGPGYRPPEFPAWLNFADRMCYGLPSLDGHGVKIADDDRGEPFDPTNGDRAPSPGALLRLRRLLERRLPDLAEAPLLEARVCQYQNTPDGHLILDRHPEIENAWILGGGSGHGFKLAPALGERLARMVLDGAEGMREFYLDRFKPGAGLDGSSASQYDL
ncbi:MAG: FAD-dependent oxidoreductase [bacterium]|nr:FAD-dependent oxidoreductase [bacterium]